MRGHSFRFTSDIDNLSAWECTKCKIRLGGSNKPPADWVCGLWVNGQYHSDLGCEEFIAAKVMQE